MSIVKPAYNRPPSVYGYITSCERLSRTGRAGQRRANQLDNLLSGIGGYPGRDILRTGIGWMNGRVLCGLLNVFLHFLFLSFDNRDSLLLLFAYAFVSDFLSVSYDLFISNSVPYGMTATSFYVAGIWKN